MPAATPPAATPPLDFNSMSKQRKLAALCVMLGPESASVILRSLKQADIEAVCAEMAKIDLVNQHLQKQVLGEFTNVAVEASAALLGGVEFTQTVLEKAMGVYQAQNIVGRLAPSRTPVAAMQEMVEMDPRQIYNLLKNEQAQMIALVLSYLPAEKAAQVLVMLRTEMRDQVVEKLATLAPTPIEVVEKIIEVLRKKTSGKPSRALNQTGGLKSAAALLNATDKTVTKAMLVALEERNAELAQQIQQKMFTFEDLANLKTAALQRVLREVDLRELAVALKSASDRVKTELLNSISKRAAETVKEEITFMGALKLRDIEAAQGKVIEIVRRLESEGEIELGGGSEAA